LLALEQKGLVSKARKHTIQRKTTYLAANINNTYACNLRCRYCQLGRENEKVSSSIADCLKFFINEIGKEARALSVGINYQGEPLLDLDNLKETRRLCIQIERDRNIGVEFAFTTNGTIMNDGILAFIRDELHSVTISSDGPKTIHDAIRVRKDGTGTYDAIIETINAIKRLKKKLVASTTLTSRYPYPAQILKHIIDLGFDSILIKHVTAPATWEFVFNPENLPELKKGYDELRDFLFETVIAGEFKYFAAMFNDHDLFGRFLYRILMQRPVFYRCPAGKFKISIDPYGDIYPCDGLIGMPEFKMGSIETGVEKEEEDYWWNLHVDYKPVCEDCWARYLCGGGCYARAWLINGKVLKPEYVECELFKHLATLAIEFCYKLEHEHPEQFEKVMIMAQERM
jgi:uncharacterized protein